MYQETAESRRATLVRAYARRADTLTEQLVEAWRLLNGLGDGGPPGLTIDRYGPWFVVAAREAIEAERAEAWGRAALELWPGEGLVVKTLARTVRESSSRVVVGRRPEAPIVVREGEARFWVEVDDGLSTGLFLDQRDARARAKALAAGHEVLNLFAYTCAFSVQAALGGAARVTSVDVAKRSLRRGRENMVASGLDPDRHRWFPDDVFTFLARQERKPPAYGLVIVDPPVFGHGKNPFNLERDLGRLLRGCIRATQPGGSVLASTHLLTVDPDHLAAVAHAAAREAGRGVEVLEVLGLPAWDHPVPAPQTGPAAEGEDRGNYLKTLVLRVGEE